MVSFQEQMRGYQYVNKIFFIKFMCKATMKCVTGNASYIAKARLVKWLLTI